MLRFSCFDSETHSHKPKKTVQVLAETMEDYSESQRKKDFAEDSLSNGNGLNPSSSSVMHDSKSEGFKSVNDTESDSGARNIRQMRKSVSLGSGLVDYKQKGSAEKEDCENSEARVSGEGTGDSSNRSTRSQHAMVKSSSSPFLMNQSRSSEDLKALDSRREDSELQKGKNVQEDYSGCRWDELPSKDFKIKRIEKWVMDLKHCPLGETDQLTDSDLPGQNANETVSNVSRIDAKPLPGMDLAEKYISSLSPLATSVNLANHGLAVVPFLSSFSSLKVLDLSGNAIVRITAGSLPRGLHILNLSKNSISTIEGLRELTRLRVLDLSYNRILRIGHGLASCTSLKELYLNANKISEVEGLHRLLKLNVLDLRFNKLSTTKSLGQLAANYNSLQAISLEGNPAQKNIGDEPLKKYLLGLLPHLAYFNRQSIKSGAMKDSADRAARLGISAHQIDHGPRAESKSKTVRKSTHGRKSQPAAVASQGGRVRLPVKMMSDRQRFVDSSLKVESLRPDVAVRRSRSEGLLGDF